MAVQEVLKPAPDEYDEYFERYIELVPEPDIQQVLLHQQQEVAALFSGFDNERAGYRYEPGKWSVRELLGHIIDSERVFGYRALCIARGEQASLPSFEQDDYAGNAGHDAVPLPELLEEFLALRESHIAMFRHLPSGAWFRVGRANERPASVRALAYIMAGHIRHHLRVLKERYHL